MKPLRPSEAGPHPQTPSRGPVLPSRTGKARPAGHPCLALQSRRFIGSLVSALLAALLVGATSAASSSSNPRGTGPAPATSSPADIRIDFTHLEAFREATWVDVPLPADSVTLVGLRVLTANRNWLLKLCELPSDPGSCTLLVGRDSSPPRGRSGDFSNLSLNLPYSDRSGTHRLHLQATPAGGDWMILRLQAVVRP